MDLRPLVHIIFLSFKWKHSLLERGREREAQRPRKLVEVMESLESYETNPHSSTVMKTLSKSSGEEALWWYCL